MTLNENTISKIASVIASKEPDSPNYMKGPELVKEIYEKMDAYYKEHTEKHSLLSA